MVIALNIYGGTAVVASAFVSFFIIGNSGINSQEGTSTALPYVFAFCMLLFDTAIRGYSWKFGHHPLARPTPRGHRLTRKGVIDTPRATTLPLPEALFSPSAGGQFMFIPIWLIAIAVAVAATGYSLGWFNSFPAPGEHTAQAANP